MIGSKKFHEALTGDGPANDATLKKPYDQIAGTRRAYGNQGKKILSIAALNGKALKLEPDTAAGIVKVPKQYEDSRWRSATKQALERIPRDSYIDRIFKPYGIKREDVDVAIQGGLNGISWTFEENKIVHALWQIRNERGNADSLKVTRTDLYEALGTDTYIDKDGKRRFYEGPRGKRRALLHKTLMDISNRNLCFIFSAITGKNKKGQPVRTLALDYAPVIKIVPVFRDVPADDFARINVGPTLLQSKRLSHYIIYFNRNVIGQNYFTALPLLLAKEISDFRTHRGQSPSSKELDFIEFLCTVNETPVEINFMKLANKLHIKSLHDTRRVRANLARCYETAQALGFVQRIDIDEAGQTGAKDVIHLNPARFPYLRQKYSNPPPPAGAYTDLKRCVHGFEKVRTRI
jgi:hypothetical protein